MLQEENYTKMREEKGQSMIKYNQVDTSTDLSEQAKPMIKKSAFLRLLRYTYMHKELLIIGNISLIFTSLAFVAIPYLCGQMIDIITQDSGKDRLNLLTLEFLGVMLTAAFFSFIRGYAYNLLGEKIMIELRNELFSKLVQKDIEFFDQNRSGELISRLTADIATIQSGASDTISILLRNMIQFVGAIVLLWYTSWKLASILFIVIPPFSIGAVFFVKYYKTYSKQYQNTTALATQVATEVLGNMRVVRSFSTEKKEMKQYGDQLAKAYEVGRKRAILGALFGGVAILLGNCVILSILYYGGSLVISGEITVGDLSSIILYTITLTVSLASVSGMINIMIAASAVSEKIFSLMDEEIRIVNGYTHSENLTGEIKFIDVKFTYPSKEKVVVLSNLNLHIKSGEVCAFVGQSGSGKSTIVSLLQRFYDVQEGRILIDDVDIRSYDIEQLHRKIGYVAQEPTLFSGTLRENIVYGVDKATDEEIDNAMKLANAYEFVSNFNIFPEGLQTIVGERGVKLSGGQKQRIAIARALIKNPKILIFDEATSALDSESEYQVQQAIDGLVQSGQKTIILIAHRLSTVINSNKIVVIQNGEIAEIGTHTELIAKNSVYKQLIERQLS